MREVSRGAITDVGPTRRRFRERRHCRKTALADARHGTKWLNVSCAASERTGTTPVSTAGVGRCASSAPVRVARRPRKKASLLKSCNDWMKAGNYRQQSTMCGAKKGIATISPSWRRRRVTRTNGHHLWRSSGPVMATAKNIEWPSEDGRDSRPSGRHYATVHSWHPV